MLKHLKPTQKQVTLAMILLVMGIFLGLFFYQKIHQIPPFNSENLHGTYVPPGRSMVPFKLEDTQQQTFKASDLIGHWTLLFFGFTQCRSICPTTMAELHKMYDILKQERSLKSLPKVYMISLDPAHDSLEKLRNYVQAFDKEFNGALGTKNEIDTLSQYLGIVYDTGPRQDGQIDHSGTITVINPAGEVAAFFTPPLQAQWMAKDMIVLMQHFANLKY